MMPLISETTYTTNSSPKIFNQHYNHKETKTLVGSVPRINLHITYICRRVRFEDNTNRALHDLSDGVNWCKYFLQHHHFPAHTTTTPAPYDLLFPFNVGIN